MMSNCSHHPLKPLDPANDPAYHDGPPPTPHRTIHAGEIPTEWPIGRMPEVLRQRATISLETLEDEIERAARREERSV
jgi:hypothetical protein